MDTLYFSIGGFVFVIGIFKREMLVREESFRPILTVSVVLFAAGLIIHFTEAGRDSACGALICPLISLGWYRFCRKVFVKRFGHEPRDTWNIWDDDMGADRLFNIVYFGSVGWLLMLVTVGMLELAKRGW